MVERCWMLKLFFADLRSTGGVQREGANEGDAAEPDEPDAAAAESESAEHHKWCLGRYS